MDIYRFIFPHGYMTVLSNDCIILSYICLRYFLLFGNMSTQIISSSEIGKSVLKLKKSNPMMSLLMIKFTFKWFDYCWAYFLGPKVFRV